MNRLSSLPSAPQLPLLPPPHQVEADDEPLKVSQVECPEDAARMVRSCWEGRTRRGRGGSSSSLYESGDEFLELVKQVRGAPYTIYW